MRRIAALALISLVGCSALTERDDRPLADTQYVIVEAPAATSTTMPAIPVPTYAVIVYLVRDQGLLSRTRLLQSEPGVAALIDLLVGGPTADEANLGLRSILTNRADLVLGASVVEQTAVIDLAGDFTSLSGEEQILALGQIVLTALTLPAISTVAFTQQGAPISVIGPTGAAIEGPVARADFTALLSR
jgi:spore germination protein GerM